MPVERPLGQNPFLQPQPEADLEIEIVNPESVSMETPEGGMVIDFDPNAGVADGTEHDANLAEYIDEAELREIASELVSAYQSDRDSRGDWEETYINGLDLLGLKHADRTTPWDGACGVFHPLLTESVIRFQAQASQDLFPAAGPVKTAVVGSLTVEKQEQANRV